MKNWKRTDRNLKISENYWKKLLHVYFHPKLVHFSLQLLPPFPLARSHLRFHCDGRVRRWRRCQRLFCPTCNAHAPLVQRGITEKSIPRPPSSLSLSLSWRANHVPGSPRFSMENSLAPLPRKNPWRLLLLNQLVRDNRGASIWKADK